MNIFSEIEHLKGEKYSSKILCILLQQSLVFRLKFIEIIQKSMKSTELSAFPTFVCHPEVPTYDEQYGDGMIDLMIELENAIIGIENKFHSNFQYKQPEKYIKSIKKKARELDKTPFLIVLFPESRRQYIENHINKEKNDITHFLSWENMLSSVSKPIKAEKNMFTSVFQKKNKSIFEGDTISEFLFVNFRNFISDNIEWIKDF